MERISILPFRTRPMRRFRPTTSLHPCLPFNCATSVAAEHRQHTRFPVQPGVLAESLEAVCADQAMGAVRGPRRDVECGTTCTIRLSTSRIASELMLAGNVAKCGVS